MNLDAFTQYLAQNAFARRGTASPAVSSALGREQRQARGPISLTPPQDNPVFQGIGQMAEDQLPVNPNQMREFVAPTQAFAPEIGSLRNEYANLQPPQTGGARGFLQNAAMALQALSPRTDPMELVRYKMADQQHGQMNELKYLQAKAEILGKLLAAEAGNEQAFADNTRGNATIGDAANARFRTKTGGYQDYASGLNSESAALNNYSAIDTREKLLPSQIAENTASAGSSNASRERTQFGLSRDRINAPIETEAKGFDRDIKRVTAKDAPLMSDSELRKKRAEASMAESDAALPADKRKGSNSGASPKQAADKDRLVRAYQDRDRAAKWLSDPSLDEAMKLKFEAQRDLAQSTIDEIEGTSTPTPSRVPAPSPSGAPVAPQAKKENWKQYY